MRRYLFRPEKVFAWRGVWTALSRNDGLEPLARKKAIVFRTLSDQVSLWEAVLPPELSALATDQQGRCLVGRSDVPEVQLPAGISVAVPGGPRFDHLAAVLPDSVGRGGAPSNDVDEVEHSVGQCRGRPVSTRRCWPRRSRRSCAYLPGSRGHDCSRGAGNRAHGIAAKLRPAAKWVITMSKTAWCGSPVSSPPWPWTPAHATFGGGWPATSTIP